MNKLTIEDIQVAGKKVLLRVDFNVPVDDQQRVTDDTRIQAAMPTISRLLQDGARLILLSHRGRPDGQRKEKYSLRPVAERLEKILGAPVSFSPDLFGPVAQTAIDNLQPGHCLMMENVRFYPEEEANDLQFAKELASLGDKFVMDAFGTAHRAHASTEGVARHFKDAACGYLMQKELKYLGTLKHNPERPYFTITGGAKVSDKVQLLDKLLDFSDGLIIGGGMAYSFLAVKGFKVGSSLVDKEHLKTVEEVFAKAERLGRQIYLPQDHVIAQEFKADSPAQVTSDANIPDGWMGLDIGPKTIAQFSEIALSAKTLFWNGPMGVFEWDAFNKGTFALAQAVAQCQGVTVVGGGDSVAAITQAGLADKVSHVSTGGGASLEFIQNDEELPGVAALAKSKGK